MSIKRPLVALSVAAVVALAGCTSETDGQNPPSSPSAEASPEAGAGAPEPDLEDVPDVVAEVNGEDVERAEFVTAYEGQLQQAAMSQQTTGQEVDQDALKQQVAEQLVGNRLLTQAATEAGIEATDEDIETTLEGIAAQNGLQSADEVVAALGEQGISEDEVREDAAAQFQVNAYIEAEADIEEPSEDELREQYDTLVEQMGSQGGEGASQAEIPPFEDVRDQLAQQAVGEQQAAAVDGIVATLRDEGDVTIHL
ncbi:peptidyl-prolyl cis-trans isomerase SurA [Isoptericola sp. CG 20/1183]|uniref:Peptidyl-prolyl cis-trans isomerase SurA n=1 Tax=Isoptericola halotolerans TaxID=300560 RepID=A0ABX5EJ14_9MICO|nr:MULTISPECIES: SurA N-terminal domain-containing protein [Isoptericola]PRZ09679.1 peptidyl-prolyl cis-trans isomerase SurA [Isoptericola sp. CG 20/1183]PRZ10480.1 peptidyl-prolyl cis-trans isomerase SurA [Isoptericola halotolerans]